MSVEDVTKAFEWTRTKSQTFIQSFDEKSVYAAAGFTAGLAVGATLVLARTKLRFRFHTAADIPRDFFKFNRTIKGVVVK